MIIISIDIVKQTYIPTSFPSSSFFLFYNGKHPQTLDYISVNIGQTLVIFYLFLENVPNFTHLCSLLGLYSLPFC